MAILPVVAAGLISLAACGRVGFDPEVQFNDDATVFDATTVIPDAACVRGPFGPPVRLSEVSSGDTDQGGWISDDGLEIIFGSLRSGSGDLYQSRRATVDEPFDAPTLALPTNDLMAAEDNAELSIDNLTIWFDRARTLRKATRPDHDSPFGVDTYAELTPTGNEFAIAFTRDGLRLAYTTDNSGSTPLKVSISERATIADDFPNGIEQSQLNTTSFNCCATFSPDGQSIMYSSSDPAPLHLAVAQWNGSQYVNPTAFDTMNIEVTARDFDAYWSRNGRFLLFSSTRGNTNGAGDLYLMTAECQ